MYGLSFWLRAFWSETTTWNTNHIKSSYQKTHILIWSRHQVILLESLWNIQRALKHTTNLLVVGWEKFILIKKLDNFFLYKYYPFLKKFTVTRHSIFWCAWESTSKNLPKSQLDVRILMGILFNYCKTKSKFLLVDETYINKGKKIRKEKPKNKLFYKII